MKFRLLTATAFFLCCTTSCLKNDNNQACQDVAPETEAPKMAAFCDAEGIVYTKLSNGLFYQVIEAGTGAAPTIESRVSVIYKGTLLNGTQFDATATPVTFPLKGLIAGWQAGLPLIKKGGRIKLVVPSYMGYGCTGVPGVGSNAPLYFDITLSDVQ